MALSLVSAIAAEEGIASWYGPNFNGRKTSNGEIYDQEKMTAAHRTLPFNTYLRVQNLDNGSSVVVRVNDRGPFAKNRVIDLSAAAARILGIIPTGTARVSFSPIREEEALAWKGGPLAGAPAAKAAPAPVSQGSRLVAQRYRIQVASYRDETNARATIERLKMSGLSASLERAPGHARVVFPDLAPDEARAISARLDGLGYRGVVVTGRSPAPVR
jgi:rare lipoprotein A